MLLANSRKSKKKSFAPASLRFSESVTQTEHIICSSLIPNLFHKIVGVDMGKGRREKEEGRREREEGRREKEEGRREREEGRREREEGRREREEGRRERERKGEGRGGSMSTPTI